MDIFSCIDRYLPNESTNKVKACVGNETDRNICLYEEKWAWRCRKISRLFYGNGGHVKVFVSS